MRISLALCFPPMHTLSPSLSLVLLGTHYHLTHCIVYSAILFLAFLSHQNCRLLEARDKKNICFFFFMLYFQHLVQCLAYRRLSIFVEYMNVSGLGQILESCLCNKWGQSGRKNYIFSVPGIWSPTSSPPAPPLSLTKAWSFHRESCPQWCQEGHPSSLLQEALWRF